VRARSYYTYDASLYINIYACIQNVSRVRLRFVCPCRSAGSSVRVYVCAYARVYEAIAAARARARAYALPFSRRVRGRVPLVGLIRRLCVCVCTRRQVNWSSAYSREPSASSVFECLGSCGGRLTSHWRGSSSCPRRCITANDRRRYGICLY